MLGSEREKAFAGYGVDRLLHDLKAIENALDQGYSPQLFFSQGRDKSVVIVDADKAIGSI